MPVRVAGRKPSRGDVESVLSEVGLADRARPRPRELLTNTAPPASAQGQIGHEASSSRPRGNPADVRSRNTRLPRRTALRVRGRARRVEAQARYFTTASPLSALSRLPTSLLDGSAEHRTRCPPDRPTPPTKRRLAQRQDETLRARRAARPPRPDRQAEDRYADDSCPAWVHRPPRTRSLEDDLAVAESQRPMGRRRRRPTRALRTTTDPAHPGQAWRQRLAPTQGPCKDDRRTAPGAVARSPRASPSGIGHTVTLDQGPTDGVSAALTNKRAACLRQRSDRLRMNASTDRRAPSANTRGSGAAQLRIGVCVYSRWGRLARVNDSR